MNGSIIIIIIIIIIFIFIFIFIIKEDVAQMVTYSKSFLERNEDRYLTSPYVFHCYLSSMFFPLCYMLQFLDIIVTTCFGPAFFLSFLGFRCFRRKVALNGLCERCCCENEDILHALWGCQGVKEIWWEMVQCRTFLSDRFASFRDLFQGILLHKSPKFAELFAFIAWSIWFNRNAQRVGSSTIPISKIHRDAVERLQEFQMLQDIPLPSPKVVHPAHWLLPLLHQYKANCDGAVFRDINSAGLGVVIRDSAGLVIATLSERICLPSTVNELDALACKRAIAFALEIGLHEVAFEGDFDVAFKHLNAEPPLLGFLWSHY